MVVGGGSNNGDGKDSGGEAVEGIIDLVMFGWRANADPDATAVGVALVVGWWRGNGMKKSKAGKEIMLSFSKNLTVRTGISVRRNCSTELLC